ncbi:MAG TPA: aminotransferase class I/II-fold pyridoxal phosphate-dependent enzyme [Nocardioidaceae bacterium]|nr:aminotransferase class I/II-fold pyridoxal phosphate-dependent enzyme [Nocardioidaceae bacterium]
MTPSSTPPNPLEQVTNAQLRSRQSMKWRAYPEDVLPLWVAEMDVLPAEPVARAVTEAIGRGDTGYPAGTAYAEALSQFAAERWGWPDLDVDRTALVPDVMLGIVEVLKLLTGPRDSVVVNAPVYPPFYSFVEHLDRQVVEAPLSAELRVDLDVLGEAFAAATESRGRAAYLLCSPHNPTGTVHTREELAAIAALADEHGVRVVADEIHAPLVLPGSSFTPYLTVPGGENGFALMSASKGWNLPGIKAALAIAGTAAGDELARMPEEVGHGASHLGVLAHTAAYRDGRPWLDALLSGLAENRRLLGNLLAEHLPQVGYRPPEGTYLAWLDFRALDADFTPADDERGLVTSQAGPAGYFVEKARVALSAGPAFGYGGAGHARLNFATSQATLSEAVRRMGASV